MENTMQRPLQGSEGEGESILLYYDSDGCPIFSDDTPELIALRRSTIQRDDIDVAGFSIRSIDGWAKEARHKPAPIDLWQDYGMIYENECTCIFSDTNVGKSILAVQIGLDIARQNDKNVLYIDYELSERQFAARYTDEHGECRNAPENFFRAQMTDVKERDTLDIDPVERVMQAIGSTAADVVIIDNITWLSCQTEQSDVAGELMMRLCEMKRCGKLTIIVIAHTPKRPAGQPITLNDLGGSRKIANFMDSVVAMGRSMKGEDMRYIKHLKGRNASIKYGGDNVLVCHITREGGYLHLESEGTAPEKSQLRHGEAVDVNQLRELKAKGLSFKQIADLTGYSKTRVYQLLK